MPDPYNTSQRRKANAHPPIRMSVRGPRLPVVTLGSERIAADEDGLGPTERGPADCTHG